MITLTGRLPQIWSDPQTTDSQRKALMRCLIDKVVLDRGTRDATSVRIVWRGGAVSELEVKMKVNALAHLAHGAKMSERVLQLAQTGIPDEEIAVTLTAEGHRSPNCLDRVLQITVQRIRLAAGIKVRNQRTRWEHASSVLSANQLAARLEIPVNWLYVQIRAGRLQIDRQPNGAYLFHNTHEVIEAVKSLRDHSIEHLDLRISELHQERHQHA